MSKCEACGGDGQIEVGAYRGDENDTTTRECRLCGGVVSISSRYPPLSNEVVNTLDVSASSSALPRLLESTSGVRRVVEIATTEPEIKMTRNPHGFYESEKPVPLPSARADNTEKIKFERTMSARDADDEMNKFLRDNFRDWANAVRE